MEPVSSPGMGNFYAPLIEESPPPGLESVCGDNAGTVTRRTTSRSPVAAVERGDASGAPESEEDVVTGPKSRRKATNRLVSDELEERPQRDKVSEWLKVGSKGKVTKTNKVMSISSESEETSSSSPEHVAVSDRILRSAKRARESASGPSPTEAMEKKKVKSSKGGRTLEDEPEVTGKVSDRGEKAEMFQRTPYRTRLADPVVYNAGLRSLHSSALGAQAITLTLEVEEIRRRSPNIQGKLSGAMKIKLKKIKEAISIMVSRVEDTGDPQYLRVMTKELSVKLRAKEEELKRSKEEILRLKDEVKRLTRLGPPPPTEPIRAAPRIVENIVVTPDMLMHNIKMVDERRVNEGVSLEPHEDVRMNRRTRPPVPVRRALAGQQGFSDAPSSPGWLPEEKKLDEDISARIDMLVKKRRELRGEIFRDKPSGRRRVVVREGTPSDYDYGDRRDGGAHPAIAGAAPRQRPRPRGAPSALAESDTAADSDWPALDGAVSVLAPARGYQGVRRGRGTPQADRRRPPRSAAIAIRGKNEDFSYRDALLKAREAIPVEDRDVDTRVRRAANGALLIEVMGRDSTVRANRLASRIRDVLKDAADVRRPVRQARLRLSGMDDSVSVEEVICTLSGAGDCSDEDIRVGELRLGYNGLQQTFVQMPLAAALKIADRRRIKMGWSSVRVDLLRERPSQCYKCWDFGHVRGTCRSTIDYTGRCFGCGGEGHTAKDCIAELRCLVCANRGDPSSHRIGSAPCEAVRRAREARARTPINRYNG